ncbi:MAG: hypothetical protein IH986_07640, partial [Planctomycetes bacterium]|nr:hypothetical protein [Planctomycetota bacterium]
PGTFVDFEVLADGTLEFDPIFDNEMTGRGGTTLVIDGHEIIVDATALTPGVLQTGLVLTTGPSSSQLEVLTEFPIPFTLLSGKHRLAYATKFANPGTFVDFEVLADGTLEFDPIFDNEMTGRGGTTLVIDGHEIIVDATALTPTALQTELQLTLSPGGALEVLTECPFSLTLLSGKHLLAYGTGVSGSGTAFAFEVLPDGSLDFDPNLDPILIGRGTPNLLIHGSRIQIDARHISASFFTLNPVGTLSNDICQPLVLLPGLHFLNIAGAPVVFLASIDGTVDFDASFDTIVDGRGMGILSFRCPDPLNCDPLPDCDPFPEIGPAQDSDGDGVFDPCDICPGFDDNIDTDGDGIPDGCDNQPPVAVCAVVGENPREATGSNGALVQLDGTASTDPDGDPLSYHWDVSNQFVLLDDDDIAMPSGIFPAGITMATLTVTDGFGGFATCDVTVIVTDTTPPTVACTTDFAVLWPPNHDLRTVTLTVMATDAVSDPTTINVQALLRSDEPDNATGLGDGDTTGDVDGQDAFASAVDVSTQLVFDATIGNNGAWVATVQLRAERDGNNGADGRCYTLNVTATDQAGNESNTSCCVVVPHDRRR